MSSVRPEPDFAAAREAMIDSQLKPEGVTDPVTLAAMASIPRERFVPAGMRELAYADRPVPLGRDRALAPPVALGLLLDALLPKAGERALVVGAATGYSAALLASIGLDVIALDSGLKPLSATGAKAVEGPLGEGHATGAPYDLILIDGAVEAIPEAIIGQMRDGGRLGAAIVDRGVTRLVIGRRSGSAFGTRSIGDSAMPRLPGFERPKAFTF